jgi:hypothetical protein
MIRVSDASNPGLYIDASDAVFTILPARVIYLTSPDGGEYLEAGLPYNITWNTTGAIQDVRIEYTADNSNWNTIAAFSPNTGTYMWIVPADYSMICKVKISDVNGPATDESHQNFEIAPLRTLTVLAPNGGEDFKSGSAYDIAWSSSGVIGNVNIEYSIDTGASWQTIVANTLNNGLLTWTPPEMNAVGCLIRISDPNSAAIDVSDSVFSISIPTISQLEREAL